MKWFYMEIVLLKIR